MMDRRTLTRWLRVAALMAAGTFCSVASGGSEFELELAAGYAWDDNVGLDELERATGESDEVTTLEAQGSALFSYKDRASIRVSAGLVDDSYQKFSQVDRRTESLGVNLETQVREAHCWHQLVRCFCRSRRQTVSEVRTVITLSVRLC